VSPHRSRIRRAADDANCVDQPRNKEKQRQQQTDEEFIPATAMQGNPQGRNKERDQQQTEPLQAFAHFRFLSSLLDGI